MNHPYFQRRLGGDAFGSVLSGPVVPSNITGAQVLKWVLIGFAGVWLLKGLSDAFKK